MGVVSSGHAVLAVTALLGAGVDSAATVSGDREGLLVESGSSPDGEAFMGELAPRGRF